MASEAQRLIGISLTKIAQSRANRGGVSLHKNLLVATVLQKARYIFMEEAYNMVHYQAAPAPAAAAAPSRTSSHEDLVGLTAEEAGIDSMPLSEDVEEASNLEFLQPSCVKCSENQDKENQPPFSTELTYLDLDKTPSNNNSSSSNGNGGSNSSSSNNSSVVFREKSSSPPCLKRRRAVTDWETEEAVQSILPKRSRCTEEGDDSVFLDDATILSDNVTKEVEAERTAAAATTTSAQEVNSGSAMEIDRITSLVSIFSFGMGEGKLNRSVSTPDLCSAQAKDTTGDALQQRPFIAMTV